MASSAHDEDQWPHGVVTKDDMHKFCLMLAGPGGMTEDLSDLVPGPERDTFLLVIKNGCGPCSCWKWISDVARELHADVVTEATQQNVHSAHSRAVMCGRAIEVGPTNHVRYHSCSIASCGSKCGARTSGGDSHRYHVPFDSNTYPSGIQFAFGLHSTLLHNCGEALEQKMLSGEVDPVWLHRAFYATFNRLTSQQCTDFCRAEHPSLEPDKLGSLQNPVCLFSLGPAASTLRMKRREQEEFEIVLDAGDIAVMGGSMQQKMEYELPSVNHWENIRGLSWADAEMLSMERQQYDSCTGDIPRRWICELCFFARHFPGCSFDRGLGSNLHAPEINHWA